MRQRKPLSGAAAALACASGRDIIPAAAAFRATCATTHCRRSVKFRSAAVARASGWYVGEVCFCPQCVANKPQEAIIHDK
jgi:hypothetical protein